MSTVSHRMVSTIGKHFAEKRRQSNALKAAAQAENAAAKAAAAAASTVQIPAEVLEAQKRTEYVSKCDSKNPIVVAAALDKAIAATDVTFANREYSQMIQLATEHGHYKQCLQLFQRVIDADLLPERNAFRSAIMCLEVTQQWKAANVMFAFLKDVYPLTEYDEVGMVIPRTVLQNPIPNVAELANIDESENNLAELETFFKTRSARGRLPRYPTCHKYMKELIRAKRGDEAVAQAFALFHRIKCAETPDVPAPFSPIFIHHSYTGASTEYKTDFPAMYEVASYLESIGNYSAAMQLHIYVRSLNRHIDITPIREVLHNGKTRDFVDVHSFKIKHVGFIINQLLKELRLRRGYVKAVEAKAAGVEEAKTYLRENTLHTALVHTSPLINTTIEPLVILCDRSYNNVDVRSEKPEEEITANFVMAQLARVGITAQITKASELSSCESLEYFKNNNMPEALDDIHRELVVIVSPEELQKYADREIAKLQKA